MVDVGLAMYDQEISVTKSVDELLFTGYSDEMIDVARAVPIFGSDVEVPFDKFGWFYTVSECVFHTTPALDNGLMMNLFGM